MAYRVFVRNWWRIEQGQRVPDTRARKLTIARDVETEDAARAIAQRWNATHEPGPLSRKAEFTEQ